MIGPRILVYSAVLLLLPIVVAGFDMSVIAAILLVIAMLLWRWTITVSAMVARDSRPKLILESIPMSHFVEKVRWCMDRLGVDYAEKPSGGILGVMFTGRTVPRLNFRSGLVRSSIGNSADILRYLWGRYSAGPGRDAAFLEPSAERLEMEKRIDRCGHDLQVWVYFHCLGDRELTLRLWGAGHSGVPAWQRLLMRILYPLSSAYVRYALSVTEERYAAAIQHIDSLLDDVDTRLADGRRSILGGDDINYVDIAFASIMGLWMQPDNYAAGNAAGARVARNRMPAPARADIERWLEDYPRASNFVRRMFAEERVR